jgi:hypothetical protein
MSLDREGCPFCGYNTCICDFLEDAEPEPDGSDLELIHDLKWLIEQKGWDAVHAALYRDPLWDLRKKTDA